MSSIQPKYTALIDNDKAGQKAGNNRTIESITDRFWRRVDKSGDCWEWLGYRHSGFWHGQIMSASRRIVWVHRLSWEIHNGPVPSGKCVLHTCDNPGCVNPYHLFLGTQRDNMKDMWRKGRGVLPKTQGQYNSQAKLTDGDIRVIRDLVSQGMTRTDVANFFNVSNSTVGRIVSRKLWAHV
jgi:hypothetical protein